MLTRVGRSFFMKCFFAKLKLFDWISNLDEIQAFLIILKLFEEVKAFWDFLNFLLSLKLFTSLKLFCSNLKTFEKFKTLFDNLCSFFEKNNQKLLFSSEKSCEVAKVFCSNQFQTPQINLLHFKTKLNKNSLNFS